MASRTAWTGGNLNSGLGWVAAFNAIDFTASQPVNGQVLMSTVTITNGSSLDQYLDFSIEQSIASSTIAVNACFPLWLCSLKAGGSNYWPPLTAGTVAASTVVPPWPSCAMIPIYAAASQTTLVGSTADTGQPIIIPPGSFRFIMQNLCGFTLTATVQTWDYRSYNVNLNN